jgi:diphthamide synthase (EF-2-diphthine--ammonia ligase)
MVRPAAVKRTRAWASWSTGKDSAFALHLAQDEPRTEIAGLFTTVNADAGMVAYNGVPVRLAHAQAAALGLPLHLLGIPPGCPADAREVLRRDVLAREAIPAGITTVIFGDAAGPTSGPAAPRGWPGWASTPRSRCGAWTPGGCAG